MNKFLQKLGMLAAALSAFLSASAYDFEVDGISYDITDPDAKTVEVASIDVSEDTDEINVPASVSYNGEQYAVTGIGDYAITSRNIISTITIPESVTAIGKFAFVDCYSLANIVVADENQKFSSIEGLLYNKQQTTLIYCPRGKLETITIPNSVTTIGDNAFYHCPGLVSITLPNSVTNIGHEAFYYCTGLVSITLPNSVTTIGKHAFANCSSLTSIVIPNSVTTISDGAFSECHSLTSVTLPSSLTSIGEFVFNECSGLISIIIPNTVTAIMECAFADCYSLTSITLPSSLTFIGEYAFTECRSLTAVNIPNSVTTIEEQAFFGCNSLTSIDVEVDNQSFSSNEGILYNKSQTLIIRCPGGKAGEVDIPNSVTTIGADAFAWCGNITAINIPNSVTTIEGEAFWDCSSLTSIIIPNSVVAIDGDAFYDCYNLTSVTLSNSVTMIDDCAFYGCRSLTSITSLAVTPPECGENVFEGINKQKCTLYVPAESMEAYQQAPEWKDFVLVEEVEAGIDAVEAAAADTAEVFNLTGAKVADTAAGLPAGIYIVRKGSAARKIIVK